MPKQHMQVWLNGVGSFLSSLGATGDGHFPDPLTRSADAVYHAPQVAQLSLPRLPLP